MRSCSAVLTLVGLLALAGSLDAYPVNYLSAKLGASVSTQAKLSGQADPNALLTDDPWSGGGFSFADKVQQQAFVVDFGQERTFDRVQFGSSGGGTAGRAHGLKIEASTRGPDGPWKELLSRPKIGTFQTLKLPLTTARWMRFDLGEGRSARAGSVRIYKGYEHPKLAEVTEILSKLIKPGVPGLERFYSSARSGNWKTGAAELRAYFAAKYPPESPPKPDGDTSMAQDFMDGKLDFAGIVHVEKPPFDWSYLEASAWYEHKNFLNRGRPLGSPIAAYYNTRDKKWLDLTYKLFYDWVDENPKPSVTRGAAYPTWRTLDSSMRSGWLTSQFPSITALKEFDDELWANYLHNIWEHADFLHKSKEDGGNWLSIVTSGVTGIALMFPEFKDDRAWLEYGKQGFEKNVLKDVYPDGKEKEDSPDYVGMAYGGMFGTLRALDKAGIKVDPETLRRMDRTQDYLAAVMQPNGRTPAIGDWGGGEPKVLVGSSDYFKRDDIKYVITKGAQGKAPAKSSINFPDGNWSFMRSPYDEKPFEDARHLVFKVSAGGHGHIDFLQVTAYAYGRELLIDPSMLNYEGGVGSRYAQTLYHNTVRVDEQNQPRKSGVTEKWFSNDGVDFAQARYDGYPGLTHRRSVLFVRPEYWVVHDEVTGEGEHRYEQNWHLPTKSGLTHDAATRAVRTNFAEGGNILLAPASAAGLGSEPFDFMIAPVRFGTTEDPGEGWRYLRTGPAPAVFDVVMYPFKGAAAPKVSVRTLSSGSPDTTVLEIKIDDKTDYVFVSRAGVKAMSAPEAGVSVEGEVVVVRLQGDKAVRVSGTNVKSVNVAGKDVVKRDQTVEDLDVRL